MSTSSFIPQLWADVMAKKLAEAIDADILANLGMVFWADCVPEDEEPMSDVEQCFFHCQACLFGDLS